MKGEKTELHDVEWDRYAKDYEPWGIQLPRAVTIPTREGEVEGERGDYLLIDSDGGLYPCDEETFREMYSGSEPGEPLVSDHGFSKCSECDSEWNIDLLPTGESSENYCPFCGHKFTENNG